MTSHCPADAQDGSSGRHKDQRSARHHLAIHHPSRRCVNRARLISSAQRRQKRRRVNATVRTAQPVPQWGVRRARQLRRALVALWIDVMGVHVARIEEALLFDLFQAIRLFADVDDALERYATPAEEPNSLLRAWSSCGISALGFGMRLVHRDLIRATPAPTGDRPQPTT